MIAVFVGVVAYGQTTQPTRHPGWHTGATEAIWVPSQEPARLYLPKAGLATLWFETDAKGIRLTSGERVMLVQVSGETRIQFEFGQVPKLTVNKKESPSLRGQWIAVATDPAENLCFEFPGLTYCTVHFDAATETPPTSRPTTNPSTTATTNTAVATILAELRAGRATDETIKRLQDLDAGAGKSMTDDRALVQHCIGIAYMQIGSIEKARTPIEKAYQYKKSPRQLLINRAKLDLQTKNLVVRALGDLNSALATNVDDDTVQLFGFGLQQAMERPSTASEARQYASKYAAYATALEGQHPGKRLFGSTWIDSNKYDETVRPKKLVDEERIYEREVSEWTPRAKEAKIKYDNLRRRMALEQNQRGGATQSDVERAQETLSHANTRLKQAQDNLQRVEARMPKPRFSPNFQPLVP